MITLQIAAVIHSPDAKDQVILTDESGQHNLPLPIDPTSAQGLMLAVSGSPNHWHAHLHTTPHRHTRRNARIRYPQSVARKYPLR